ncbi:hypothetical protein OTU49_003067, partial [Cherax quadricarinatus]
MGKISGGWLFPTLAIHPCASFPCVCVCVCMCVCVCGWLHMNVRAYGNMGVYGLCGNTGVRELWACGCYGRVGVAAAIMTAVHPSPPRPSPRDVSGHALSLDTLTRPINMAASHSDSLFFLYSDLMRGEAPYPRHCP